jgi:hypothetical protein
VKIAWLCSTSEDSPAGIPAAIPANSSENLTTPNARPTANTQRHGTRGLPTKNSAGSAATPKRSALNISGGKWSSPVEMATKLKPQRAVTAMASRRSRGFMMPALFG